MNLENYDFLFGQLKDYLFAKSAYSPAVLKKPMAVSPVYPQVVFAEIVNANDSMTTDRKQKIDIFGYETDIFSTNKVIGGKTIDNLVICRELSGLVDDVMSYYHFRRLSQTPTPTVDTTLYRIISRYNGRVFINFNQIL